MMFNQPEKMSTFFDMRVDHYDEHMKSTFQEEFTRYYQVIAEPIIATQERIAVLDLGCGTGNELESIFVKAPNVQITGIDLSEQMLQKLARKYSSYLEQLTLRCESYLRADFGHATYNYIVSVQTMHHFLPEVKVALYQKIKRALKPGGKYIEGDYVVSSTEAEELLARYQAIVAEFSLEDANQYHLDIPTTIDTQIQLLKEAGFATVDLLYHWGKADVVVAQTSK